MAVRFDLTTTAGIMSAIHHLTGHLDTGRVAIAWGDREEEYKRRMLVRFIGLDRDNNGKLTLFIRGTIPAPMMQDWLICCADRPPGSQPSDSTDLMARWTGASVVLNLPRHALSAEEAHHLHAQLADAIRQAGGPEQCEIAPPGPAR
ncbi:hypothetical protein ABZ815_20600 [Nonomuraea sp. NPDC047529]|uniref:hypothetical protein n=1 Tax=Nonomuraea sp. NPDC047529 TaxID=3155623 RepID=UPI0033FD8041